MNSPLNVWKNIIWAIGMVLCILALVVGLVAAAFGKAGFVDDGAVELGGDAQQSQQGTELLTLPETADAGQGYLDSITFLVDSSLIGLRDYSVVNAAQVWGSSAGNIPAAKIADPTIRYGTEDVSVSSAVSASRPAVLVIALGMDSVNEVTQSQFIGDYSSLVNSVKAQSPDTKIILCSPCSVTSGYSGTDGLNNNVAIQVDEWVQAVATNTGVYYGDVASVVCDSGGSLLTQFAGVNGKMLNSAGLTRILEYLRIHAV